jgi:hypothetical protein
MEFTWQGIIAYISMWFLILYLGAVNCITIYYGGQDFPNANLTCTAEAIVPLNIWLQWLGGISILCNIYFGFIGLIIRFQSESQLVPISWLITLLFPAFAWHSIWTAIAAVSLWRDSTSCLDALPELYLGSEIVIILETIVCGIILSTCAMGHFVIQAISANGAYQLLHVDL